MLEATYQAHLKQNVAINDNKGNRITGRCRDVNREVGFSSCVSSLHART